MCIQPSTISLGIYQLSDALQLVRAMYTLCASSIILLVQTGTLFSYFSWLPVYFLSSYCSLSLPLFATNVFLFLITQSGSLMIVYSFLFPVCSSTFCFLFVLLLLLFFMWLMEKLLIQIAMDFLIFLRFFFLLINRPALMFFFACRCIAEVLIFSLMSLV